MYQLKGNPYGVSAAGGLPVGEGYEIKLSNNQQPASLVEIRLPIQTSVGVDSSRYTVFRSEDGISWDDIGGIVEGNKIRTWTDHFTYFWPALIPAPLRPIQFINFGYYTARVFVDTYTPNPAYATAAMPGGVAVSPAPTASGAIPWSRFLILPVGAYTFCYDWQIEDGKWRHAFTLTEGLFDYDPRYLEGAHSLNIMPGTEVKWLDGQCPAARRAPAGGPVRPAPGTFTPTNTRTPLQQLPSYTFTVTLTPRVSGGAFTLTPTRTRTRTPITSSGGSRTPTKTLVNYLPYYNAWIKRIEDLRKEFIEKNCTPPYSGCVVDIGGLPTPATNGLNTHYTVNLHSSYITFAKSLEDQLLAALRPCLQEMVDNRFKGVNLDVRRGIQGQCIQNGPGAIWDREYRRIFETSCGANCGEIGKIGVIEGSPWYCACK
jgi:hypothetical protein